jgi:glutamine phosphoribosylpyrophosphate amidotransferase
MRKWLRIEYADNVALQKANIPYVELFLGHVRYGTFGKIVSSVHPFYVRTTGCTGI